jgi:hypothetical protein
MTSSIVAELNLVLNSSLQIKSIQQHQIQPAIVQLIAQFDKHAFKTTKGILFESYINIMYIKADKKICHFYLVDGSKVTILQRFADIKTLFAANDYMIVLDRGTIANRLYCKEVIKKDKQLIVQCNQVVYPIQLNRQSEKKIALYEKDYVVSY